MAWQAYLKKPQKKLELLTDIDILKIVENGTGGEICHVIHRYAKSNNKYMKDYNKGKDHDQKLPADSFEWK